MSFVFNGQQINNIWVDDGVICFLVEKEIVYIEVEELYKIINDVNFEALKFLNVGWKAEIKIEGD